MRRTLVLFALLILLGKPAGSETPKAPLDTNAVHGLYLEGDFERATGILEKALKEKRITTHADSIFAFKHLGVMYAADKNSREKGKYYMLNLVTIEPTARIMDMYASDMIYMIFKNIQEEYETTKGKLTRAESHVNNNQGLASPAASESPSPAASESPSPANPPPSAQPSPSGASKRNRNILLAGGAVAVLVGASVAAHYIMEEEAPSEKITNEIDR